MNPNLKYFFFFFFFFWGGGWEGARVSEMFSINNPKTKKKEKNWGGGVRWTDRPTGANQLAPSTSSKLGA